MKKNILIYILGVAVVALLVIVAYLIGKGQGDNRGPDDGPGLVEVAETNAPPVGPLSPEVEEQGSETNALPVGPQSPEAEKQDSETNAPPKVDLSVERKPLPAPQKGDFDSLPGKDEPQDVTTRFEAKGRGTLATAGGAGDVDFYYLMKTVATSTIEDKKEFDSGKIKVSEIRSFSEATEIMAVTNANVRVDLSTLPLDAIENTGYLIGGVAALFDPELGADIVDTVADLRDIVDSVDGTDAKPVFDLLKSFGIDVEQIVAKPVEEYLKGVLEEVHSHVNAVQGKSYRFIYWTDKEGEPLRVKYENVDHSPISLEEQNVLNYVNLFIDCQVLPKKDCRPGESWKIDPASIGTMFGAVADGTCSGDVIVHRGNDLPDGNWSLSVNPATITFYDGQRPVGNVKIDGGKGIGDGRRAVLRELQIDGTGKLRKKDSETVLWFYEFITKTEGDCQFRSTISPRRED